MTKLLLQPPDLCDMKENDKDHWEHIYRHKQPHEVSWTQEKPHLSLQLIHQYLPHKDASIIDIGAGDSKLVDFLLEEGFTNISVLDISEAAIERARIRLGEKADSVRWIVSDIRDFKPSVPYDLWHDRAAFHFLTDHNDVAQYTQLVQSAVVGSMILGTFSVDGPLKCSGLEISQYDEQSMPDLFKKVGFKNKGCVRENHVTPSGNIQNFVFCTFAAK